MKIGSNVKCLCKAENKLEFRKPDFFTPTVGVFDCVSCESKIQYRIGKSKNKGEVIVQLRAITQSKKLKTHLDLEKLGVI